MLDKLVAVGCVQLPDELGHQVVVLERLLDRGQHRPRGLSLPGVLVVAMLGAAVAAVAGLLQVNLPPQTLQVEAAQGIGTQAAALEELLGCDVRVGLQQLGRLAEGIRGHAIAREALEDEERLERGVGGDASRHAPG